MDAERYLKYQVGLYMSEEDLQDALNHGWNQAESPTTKNNNNKKKKKNACRDYKNEGTIPTMLSVQ